MGLSIGFLREPFGSDKDKILGVIRISGKIKIIKIKMEFWEQVRAKTAPDRRKRRETLGSWDLKS